uniref:Uncharacterized protein n=1 Tax=Anopheles minimus TaxID=112268 RepID=A0A182WPC7_9DIPT
MGTISHEMPLGEVKLTKSVCAISSNDGGECRVKDDRTVLGQMYCRHVQLLRGEGKADFLFNTFTQQSETFNCLLFMVKSVLIC